MFIDLAFALSGLRTTFSILMPVESVFTVGFGPESLVSCELISCSLLGSELVSSGPLGSGLLGSELVSSKLVGSGLACCGLSICNRLGFCGGFGVG